MAHLMISAAHKSSGKTTITLGLCAALRARGITVAPFKKGPDYIDPLWLTLASGRPCYNLDFWTMEDDEIQESFACHAEGSALALVEGNKGLYDGVDLEGGNSNAALAKLLGTPVVLVIDTQGITRGIAPLVLGYRIFDPTVRIAGIILNKVGGLRHEGKLRKVLARYTDVPVIGAVARDKRLVIVERHLGLVPSNEAASALERVDEIGALVAAQVDLAALQTIAHSAPPFPPLTLPSLPSTPRVRIGIPRDAAFAFYYPDDLDALRHAGAELVFFDALHDHLPEVEGLFIGGGFPEVQMEALEANPTLRSEIRTAVENGMPVYAECGGLMYLARRIQWGDRSRAMVGALPADVVMTDKPVGRGYIRMQETAAHPWPVHGPMVELSGHEFHYSYLDNLGPTLNFAYQVRRGTGIDGHHDGIVYRNVLACYSHQRNTRANPWAAGFVSFVQKKLAQRKG
ncbi:Cobyrinate a,c-diamide synthase [Gammaproteobacteria bacterium]